MIPIIELSVAFSTITLILMVSASAVAQSASSVPNAEAVKQEWAVPLPQNAAQWRNPYKDIPAAKTILVDYTFSLAPGKDGQPTLKWELVSKMSCDIPVIILGEAEVSKPFDKITLRCENKSHVRIDVAAVAVKVNGAAYIMNPLPLRPGEKKRLTFDIFDSKLTLWTKDKDDEPRLNAPIRQIGAAMCGITAGVKYQLLLDEIKLTKMPPQLVTFTSSSTRAKVKAGGSFSLPLSFEIPYRLVEDYDFALSFVRNGREYWRREVEFPAPTSQWTTGEAIKIGPIEIKVPLHALGGRYNIVAEFGKVKLTNEGMADNILGTVEVEPRSPGRVSAEVREHNGATTLFINDQPSSAMIYMTYHPTARYFEQFGKAGVHIYSFGSTCADHLYKLCDTAWVAPDEFDFSHTDARIVQILSVDPQAYVIPRCYITAPKWWEDQNPNELVMYDDGKGELKPLEEVSGRRVASWASEKWRKDMAYALKRYVEHLRGAPYGDRVIGVAITSGTTEEWMFWGANSAKACDYSEPSLKAFRNWLKEKYVSVEKLRATWRDEKVSFETAAIPDMKSRIATELGNFRDPQRAMPVIDFRIFQSELTVDTIDYFARIAKRETNSEWIVGAFYGYVMQFEGPRQQTCGHIAIDRALQSPNIDFLCSPTLYSYRTLKEGGYSTFMSLTDSLPLHGKMWINENDIRTFKVRAIPNPHGEQFDRRQTLEETIQLQRRELGNVLAHGCGQWWFDMGGGWYDDPGLLKEVARLNDIADQSVGWDRSSASEIAVIVDDTSFAYQHLGGRLNSWLILGQTPQLGMMGAPFDLFLLDDIEKIPSRKLWVFLGVFAPTERQREAIKHRVRRDGQTSLWVYAPGFVRNERFDATGIEDLTGIKVGYADKPDILRVKLKAAQHPLLAGLPEDMEYGTNMPIGPVAYPEQHISPIFYVDDPTAAILGADVSTGRAGLAVKKFDGWTSIYSSAPCLPADLLRNVARSAGVHIYLDQNDVVYANASLLSVTVSKGGERTIKLPRKMDVYNLIEEELVGEGITEFRTDFDERTSVMFQLR